MRLVPTEICRNRKTHAGFQGLAAGEIMQNISMLPYTDYMLK